MTGMATVCPLPQRMIPNAFAMVYLYDMHA
jgi:hypothetical protein